DFLICPTTPLPPFPHSNGKGGVDTVDGTAYGSPRCSLPSHDRAAEPRRTARHRRTSGFATDGLPVGLQIIGRAHADADVIAAAAVQHLAFQFRSLDDLLGS